MRLRFPAAIAASAMWSLTVQSPAWADTKEETFSLKPREQKVVGSFYEIRNSNCAVLPRPKVTVQEQPKNGHLIIEEIERTPRQEQCSHVRVPAAQVVYQAGEAGGADRFVYTVTYESRNLGTWERIGIVSIANAPAVPGDGGTPYEAAVPALKEAGGESVCIDCFLQRYAPAEMPKAFAVSKDGAYGARWDTRISIDEAKRAALESCTKKESFRPENPCVIFFENDRLVWKAQ